MNTLIPSILIILTKIITCTEISFSAVSMPATNVFAKSKDLNSLYAASLTGSTIYRMNYTRYFTLPMTYNYTTSHTAPVRSIGVSRQQRYFATGSQDYTIEVVEVFTKTRICRFTGYNQMRSLVFHPNYQQILYSASADDSIRKWNTTNCSMLVQKSIGSSVNTMIINTDGSYLAFGTYQGQVGTIDENLSSFTISTTKHMATTKFLFIMYPNYYISIGEDNKMLLWNNNSLIATLISLSPNKVSYCGVFNQGQGIPSFRIIGCYDSSGYCITYLGTRTLLRRFTDHSCARSNTRWVDFRQMSPEQEVWAIHYGSSLQVVKIVDVSTEICDQNTPHTSIDAVFRTCRHCGYNFPGCHFCDLNDGCTQCRLGVYQTAKNCTLCPVQCSECTSPTNCATCRMGYFMPGSSGKCNVAPTPQAGCFQLISSGNSCGTVCNGYYILSGQSKPCNNSIAGCMQCTPNSSPQCLTCRTGYYLNGSACTLCASFMSGCVACSNKNSCLKCAVAFKYNGPNLQCSNCLPSCQTCGTFYDTCLTCYLAQNRYLSGTSCLCSAGYYDNSTSGNYACIMCSSVLTYCYICTNNTICAQCQANYFLYTSAGKTQCQQCNQYCQTCTGISSNCTSCNSLTYHRVLSGNNCECDVGYVSISGSVPCMPCSKLNDGCLSCTNQTYCSLCDSGYYLKTINSTNKLCDPCPYYCPSCSVNGSGAAICLSCPPGTFRTLTSGDCPCDSGYFDDNRTLTCQKCSDVLTNCLTCVNRTKCLSCSPGMYTDQAKTICAACQSICLTCGTYFDTCTSCDTASNRILQNNKCVCQSFAYQKNGVCLLCQDAIPNCNSCENPYLCTGCDTGFTLAQDLKSCIDCQGQMNGCDTCTSSTNCTTCIVPFSLIHHRCRCPINMYTLSNSWGKCVSYGIPGLQSSLGVQIQAHQHQNNTLIVFIRFRAKTLYVIGKNLTDSISLSINGIPCSIHFDYINNNHVKISTQLSQTYQRPNITVIFSQNVFYNQDLLTLSKVEITTQPARLYFYEADPIKSYQTLRDILKYIFMVLKWVFFGFSILGQGHLLFPFVTFIQLMPIFLVLNMSLPANLSMVLDAMLSFQVKSVIPMLTIKSDFFVQFPPMTLDYYTLYDFIVLGKIGDMLLLLFVNVMTKFDEGIVRMFPPGRIRRYLYQSLVRRGYSVMSLCILSFQPSLIILAGAYIKYNQWQSTAQIFNYCCCLFMFGFYLAYNFNHASNLQGSKQLKNIQNQQCFFGINSQQPTAPRTTLLVLASDFWLVGAFSLVDPMIYFITCLMFLTLRVILHIKRDFYFGKIQFALRILSSIFLLAIYGIMFGFYLSQNKIYLGFDIVNILGVVTTALIFAYMLFHILQKILYNLKLQSDFLQNKVVQNQNGQKIVVVNQDGVENVQNAGEAQKDDQSSRSHKMKQFFNNSNTNANNAFSGRNFRNRNATNIDGLNEDKQSSNYPMENNQFLSTFNGNSNDINARGKGGTQILPNRSDAFFKNSNGAQLSQKQKYNRIKSANTSKYAKNHLELRYKAQAILTKQADKFND